MNLLQAVGGAAALTMLALPCAAAPAHDQFFAALQGLCGATFEGKSVFPADPAHDLFGKALVAQVASCTADEIRIPFAVGQDRSRTWIIRREQGGLTLRHDHRHADGTPDPVTMYGGAASAQGDSHSQFFAADAYTGKLIAGAATNVWNIALTEDGQLLTYYLERDAKPRFKAELRRRK